jgi:hypothetical protein
MDWPLVTGGKPIISIPAWVIIAFELTILFGALSTVPGLFINARLPQSAARCRSTIRASRGTTSACWSRRRPGASARCADHAGQRRAEIREQVEEVKVGDL